MTHPFDKLDASTRSQLQHETATAFILARGAVQSSILSGPARMMGLWLAFLENVQQAGAALGLDETIGAEQAVQITAESLEALGGIQGVDPRIVEACIDLAVVPTDALDYADGLHDLGDDFADPRIDDGDTAPRHAAWTPATL